jgi:hypothetical protein
MPNPRPSRPARFTLSPQAQGGASASAKAAQPKASLSLP